MLPRPLPSVRPNCVTTSASVESGLVQRAVAGGYTTECKRMLIALRLGQRESHEDWLDLGRDLARRGLRSLWMVVTEVHPAWSR
jgi:transposase-like protein